MKGLLDDENDKTNERYRIIEKISEGQFGTVFRAFDQKMNTVVALKKMYTNMKSESKMKLQIEREIKIMSSLDHKNLLKLMDHEVKDTGVNLIFEQMETDLKTFIERTSFPLKNSKDLKPSNILLDSKGEVKIGDFGSATFIKEAEESGQFELEGFSRWYKSPEQIYGSRNYDQRVDIWSFALVYAELLNGAPLFPGMNDLDQMARIHSVLGTPTNETWKEFESLPDYGKIIFKEKEPQQFESVFPNGSRQEIQFLKSVLRYDRPNSVKEILNHPYFFTEPLPKKIKFISVPRSENSSVNYYKLLS